MDGTLLDENSQLPEGFWELFAKLARRGIIFIPASGRQLATLQKLFQDKANAILAEIPASDHTGSIDFLAENGNVIFHRGEIVHSTAIEPDVAPELIRRAIRLEEQGMDIGLILCAAERAYYSRSDQEFIDGTVMYYASNERVDDLSTVDDTFVKFAVYVDDADTAVHEFQNLPHGYNGVVSGLHWVDIMNTSINKGVALKKLQELTGITPAQTVVFGDYLNDLQMMAQAEYSFAMANAHDDLKAAARYIAPSNADNGVVTVLRHLLGLED